VPTSSTIAVPEALWPWVTSTLADFGPPLVCLLGAGLVATFRDALERAVASRTLDGLPERRRERLAALLERSTDLGSSAALAEVFLRASFAVLLYRSLGLWGQTGAAQIWTTIGVAVPSMLIGCVVLPQALVPRLGDALLVRTLVPFSLLHAVLRLVSWLFSALQRAVERVVGVERQAAQAQMLVEGLRDVIVESEAVGELDEAEKEIIGNVIESRDVPVSAVMTPRTEIIGIDGAEPVAAAAQTLAASGHSRLPVWDGGPDAILGYVTARDLVGVAATGAFHVHALRDLLHPVHFVPETKTISELLAEFRRDRLKLVIALDEYGGTAGLVTLDDLLREVVGEMSDETDEKEPQRIKRLADGSALIDASLRVAEVNEELGTSIPESESYETLAGAVLFELGRFPKPGETLELGGRGVTITQASDRRVVEVKLTAERRSDADPRARHERALAS